MLFNKEKHECPFCNREHTFDLCNLVPIQKFDLHRNTVQVTTTILKVTPKMVIRQWDWEIK